MSHLLDGTTRTPENGTPELLPIEEVGALIDTAMDIYGRVPTLPAVPPTEPTPGLQIWKTHDGTAHFRIFHTGWQGFEHMSIGPYDRRGQTASADYAYSLNLECSDANATDEVVSTLVVNRDNGQSAYRETYGLDHDMINGTRRTGPAIDSGKPPTPLELGRSMQNALNRLDEVMKTPSRPAVRRSWFSRVVRHAARRAA